MSEVKKIIISRKKIDQNGNEYALMKISSSQQKRPEIRVLKFRKSSKASRKKKRINDEDSITSKTISSKPDNKGLIKIKNDLSIKKNNYYYYTKISELPTTKTSFVSTFNTPSKRKNSFIYKSPNHIHSSKRHIRHSNQYKLNNYLYSPNLTKNYSMFKNNSDIFKTECTFSNEMQQQEILKKKENLNNKIMILSQQNKDYFAKINNLKLKETKLNNIKVKKLKNKEEIQKAIINTKNEKELKKKILNEIKEIDKYKKKAVNQINMKEKKIMKNNLKKENTKIKNLIKKEKMENYQKNRLNYLKIKKEEDFLKIRRNRHNLSRIKKTDNNQYNNEKTIVLNKSNNKEINQLRKKYEKLKMINNEYNLCLKDMNDIFQRTFTPLNFNKFTQNHFSNSFMEIIPKKIFSHGNSPQSNDLTKNNRINNNIDQNSINFPLSIKFPL